MKPSFAPGLVRAGGSVVFTYYGWFLVLQGGLTLGSFLAFTAYLGMVQEPLALPLRRTSVTGQELLRGRAAFVRSPADENAEVREKPPVASSSTVWTSPVLRG